MRPSTTEEIKPGDRKSATDDGSKANPKPVTLYVHRHNERHLNEHYAAWSGSSQDVWSAATFTVEAGGVLVIHRASGPAAAYAPGQWNRVMPIGMDELNYSKAPEPPQALEDKIRAILDKTDDPKLLATLLDRLGMPVRLEGWNGGLVVLVSPSVPDSPSLVPDTEYKPGDDASDDTPAPSFLCPDGLGWTLRCHDRDHHGHTTIARLLASEVQP